MSEVLRNNIQRPQAAKRYREEEDETEDLSAQVADLRVAKKVRFFVNDEKPCERERVYEENDFGSAAFYQTRAGVKDGVYQTWYPNGGRKELATMSAGKEDGLVQQWFPSGQPYMLYTAKKGLKEGVAFRWYSNGMLAAQEFYRGDKEDGLATYYYESGAKQLELLFERGALVSVQHYDSEAAGSDY